MVNLLLWVDIFSWSLFAHSSAKNATELSRLLALSFDVSLFFLFLFFSDFGYVSFDFKPYEFNT